ncbi:hypothetical protein CEUSTIGMA_g11842.t1 [Chlamydomonas eustigma]|uniref:Ribosomal eL28/Mak16 domain-containing protein n=1 Tax=Chlamydomonas eustigma TaxID=1157962 RepID=A0A250XMV1_9CHLO|nr:hypothetical protein CEUSTIGMA_g11842.t1 [Chlamydomonas eustigma]|eukprot:GAX84421.1 hypothetical protein CEUSTIGMA_g11842.t1 [Chlamydomonas eustigma]
MSSALVWQIVRAQNSFMRTGLHGHKFSAEPGNLYNKHSYKYSGIANANSVDVSLENDTLKLSTGRPKTANQPKKSKCVQMIKKNARRALVGICKQAGSVRPDLKQAAQARAAALAKSLRVKKATK